jgi:hypothetical protein
MECCVCEKWSRTKESGISTCDWCDHPRCWDCDFIAYPKNRPEPQRIQLPTNNGSSEEYKSDKTQGSGKPPGEERSDSTQLGSHHEAESKYTRSSEEFTLAFRNAKPLPPSSQCKVMSTCCKCKAKADVTFVVQDIPPCANCNHAPCPDLQSCWGGQDRHAKERRDNSCSDEWKYIHL